ncbi:MAG TPA: hypothetical protein VLK82_19360 [Candidatus Tectomicrobia bacterium]|nr:hypothetical protein [Candidatus Tectomicrobia bacterium]
MSVQQAKGWTRRRFLTRLDAGDPIALLARARVGCFELFGTERVRAIREG